MIIYDDLENFVGPVPERSENLVNYNLPKSIERLVIGTPMGDYFSQQMELHQSGLVTDDVYENRIAALSSLAKCEKTVEAITNKYDSVDSVVAAVKNHMIFYKPNGTRRLMNCPDTMGWSTI